MNGLDRDRLVGLYRWTPLTRGWRSGGRPLQAGQDPRFLLHRPRQRGRVCRGGGGDAARGRGRRRIDLVSTLPAAPSPGGAAGLPRTRGRPLTRPRRQCPSRRLRSRADHDRQSPAGDAPRRRRLRARVSHARRAARRRRLVRRRRVGEGRLPRGDELRGREPAAGRVHLRQQPVRVLDADPPVDWRWIASR